MALDEVPLVQSLPIPVKELINVTYQFTPPLFCGRIF